nr:hypothetical protein [uncultured bacterium]
MSHSVVCPRITKSLLIMACLAFAWALFSVAVFKGYVRAPASLQPLVFLSAGISLAGAILGGLAAGAAAFCLRSRSYAVCAITLVLLNLAYYCTFLKGIVP